MDAFKINHNLKSSKKHQIAHPYFKTTLQPHTTTDLCVNGILYSKISKFANQNQRFYTISTLYVVEMKRNMGGFGTEMRLCLIEIITFILIKIDVK